MSRKNNFSFLKTHHLIILGIILLFAWFFIPTFNRKTNKQSSYTHMNRVGAYMPTTTPTDSYSIKPYDGDFATYYNLTEYFENAPPSALAPGEWATIINSADVIDLHNVSSIKSASYGPIGSGVGPSVDITSYVTSQLKPNGDLYIKIDPVKMGVNYPSTNALSGQLGVTLAYNAIPNTSNITNTINTVNALNTDPADPKLFNAQQDFSLDKIVFNPQAGDTSLSTTSTSTPIATTSGEGFFDKIKNFFIFKK